MNTNQSPALPFAPLACIRLVTRYARPGASGKVMKSPTLNGQTGVIPVPLMPAALIASFIESDSVMKINSPGMSALLGDGCVRTPIVCRGRADAQPKKVERSEEGGGDVLHASSLFFLPNAVFANACEKRFLFRNPSER